MKLASFKDFERAGWQWFEAGRFLQAQLLIKDQVAAEAFLRLPPNWAFFWKSKEKEAWLAAWGLVERIAFTDLLTAPVDPRLTICGGFPFAPAQDPSSEWQELAHEHWFVPQFVWHQDKESAVLEVVCPLARAQNDDAWKARLLEEAWRFYQALQRPAAETVTDLPPYRSRQDFPRRERWQAMLDDAQRHMQRADFSKVVLSRRVLLNFSRKISAAELFRQLLTLREESFVFALQSPDGRCFMGRSPERLLAWKNRSFQLDAIAGTRGRSCSLSNDQAYSDDMQQSPKEQNEHRLVSQAIIDLLRARGVDFEALEEQEIIRLQHVQHMRSRFKGEVPEGHRCAELLPLLHPTPAVGGYPREPALQFLLEQEGFDRGFFAGGIGVFQGREGDVAIGIRSALVDGARLWVYAGAGIVPGSDADAEWLEIEAKMQNFLGFLQADEAYPGFRIGT